jgi:hypothetical protein
VGHRAGGLFGYHEENEMTTACDLLRRQFQTLVADNAQWQTLNADDLVDVEPPVSRGSTVC